METENSIHNLIGPEAKMAGINPFPEKKGELIIPNGILPNLDGSIAATLGIVTAHAAATGAMSPKAYESTPTAKRQKSEYGEPSIQIVHEELLRTYDAICYATQGIPTTKCREVNFGVPINEVLKIIANHPDLTAPLTLQKKIHETLIYPDQVSGKEPEQTPLKNALFDLAGKVLEGKKVKDQKGNKPERLARIAAELIVGQDIHFPDIPEEDRRNLLEATYKNLDLFQYLQTPEGQLLNITVRPDIFYFSLKPEYVPNNEEEKQMLESSIKLVNGIFGSLNPWTHFNPENLDPQQYRVLREVIKLLGSAVQLNVYDIKTSWTHDVEDIKEHSKSYITDVTSTAVAMLVNLHHFYPEIGLEEFIVKAFENEGVVPYVIAANNPLIPSIKIIESKGHQPNEIRVGVFKLSELTNIPLAMIAQERLLAFITSVEYKQRKRMIIHVLTSISNQFDLQDQDNSVLVEMLKAENIRLQRLTLTELAQEVLKTKAKKTKKKKGNERERKEPIYLTNSDVNDDFCEVDRSEDPYSDGCSNEGLWSNNQPDTYDTSLRYDPIAEEVGVDIPW